MEPGVEINLKMRCVQLLEDGLSVREVSRLLRMSRPTVYKWQGRYRTDGPKGLVELSRRPHSSPKRSSARAVEEILRLRRQESLGPWRIAQRLDLSQSSVYRTLRGHGLRHLRPKQPRVIRWYEKDVPGEPFHLDITELTLLRRRTPPEQQFAVLDDDSREAFSHIYPDATTQAATDFLRRALRYYSYPIQAILTDNAPCFTMHYTAYPERKTLFDKTCRELGIRHHLVRPHRPQANGKVERFFRTVREECYDRIYFRDSDHRASALQDHVHYYNHERPHFSLGGLTPVARRNQRSPSVKDVLKLYT
jgi:transposase InsO family protein